MEILKFKPCEDAIEFRKQFNSFEEAWNNCKRGDWMLWIASELEVDKKLIVKTAGRCASTVKHLLTDTRSLNALQACEDYADGKISDSELSIYVDAAFIAVAAADTSYAAYAAKASYNAVAAYAATTENASYAAHAASYAVDAKQKNRELTANICREILTDEVFNKINK